MAYRQRRDPGAIYKGYLRQLGLASTTTPAIKVVALRAFVARENASAMRRTVMSDAALAELAQNAATVALWRWRTGR